MLVDSSEANTYSSPLAISLVPSVFSGTLFQCSDVYSLGVLVWEVWGGGVPWEGWTPPQLCVAVAERGERLPVGDQHRLVAEILRSCFAEPSVRPSVCEVCPSQHVHTHHIFPSTLSKYNLHKLLHISNLHYSPIPQLTSSLCRF